MVLFGVRAIGMTIAAPILFLAYTVDSWQMALALLVIPTALNSLYYGPAYATVQLLVPAEARAMATAMLIDMTKERYPAPPAQLI